MTSALLERRMPEEAPPERAPRPQGAHREAIGELVQASGRPAHEVEPVYVEEYERLRSLARVGDYLVLFAMRRTRERLRGGRRSG